MTDYLAEADYYDELQRRHDQAGQVEQLQRQLAAAEERIAQLEHNLETLADTVYRLEGK